jgi:hypothetical protein
MAQFRLNEAELTYPTVKTIEGLHFSISQLRKRKRKSLTIHGDEAERIENALKKILDNTIGPDGKPVTEI